MVYFADLEDSVVARSTTVFQTWNGMLIDTVIDEHICAGPINLNAIDASYFTIVEPLRPSIMYVTSLTIGSNPTITAKIYKGIWSGNFDPSSREKSKRIVRYVAIDSVGTAYRVRGWGCSDVIDLLAGVNMGYYLDNRELVDTIGALSIVSFALELEWMDGKSLYQPQKWSDSIFLFDTVVSVCYGDIQVNPPIISWMPGLIEYHIPDNLLFSVVFYTVDRYSASRTYVKIHEMMVTMDGELLHSIVDLTRSCPP